MEEDPRVSDEATGLPPLEELNEDEVMIVAAWASGEGVVQTPLAVEPIAVRYLHLRGLALSDDGTPEWVQAHVAVPVDHAIDVAVALGGGHAPT